MTRRHGAEIVAALVLAVALVVPALALNAGSAGAAGLGDPVIPGDMSDPHMFVAEGHYWAYSTNNGLGNVPFYVSSDRESWLFGGDAMPRLGSWARPGHTWAPGVIDTPDGYVLFYTARDRASGRQCIGRAVSDSPAGPFVDDSDDPFVCQLDHSGSIDASPFRDDGSLYLLWKSDDNATGATTHLWSQRLDDDAEHLIGQPSHLMAGDSPWEAPLVESPAMVSSGGAYTLFYSGNWWESARYGIGYATCSTPLGPCTKVTTQGPWVASTPYVAGPGGQSVVMDAEGAVWLVYHGWEPDQIGYAAGGARSMRIDQITFDGTTPHPHGSLAGSGLMPTDSRVVGVAETDHGFWTTDATGRVRGYDGAVSLPDMSGARLNQPMISMAATASGNGYWLVAADGGIFTFGDAPFRGSTGNLRLNKPIVGMAATPSGNGYWMVASDGGIFTFGDANFYGSTGNLRLNKPIVGMAATPSGNGYWLVASDGGIFTFGDAQFRGSTGSMALAAPVVGMAASPSGSGYWLAGADGGLYNFGDASFRGAVRGSHLRSGPVAGIVGRGDGGYSVVNIAGQVFRF